MPIDDPQKKSRKGLEAAVERTASTLKAAISMLTRGRVSSIEGTSKEPVSPPSTSSNQPESPPSPSALNSLNVNILKTTQADEQENEIAQRPIDSVEHRSQFYMPSRSDTTSIKHPEKYSDPTTKLDEKRAKEEFKQFLLDIKEINKGPDPEESGSKKLK